MNPSDPTMIKGSFFHTAQRLHHRSGMQIYESAKPSLGVVKGEYVLTPSTPLPYADLEATLDSWITLNPGILRKYTTYVLFADVISNGELYYIDDPGNGGRQFPIIQEQLMVNPLNEQPANAYVVKLFQGVGGTSPGAQISPTAGRWWVSPDQGAINFEVGYDPVTMGWGAISVTCYIYIGDTVETALSGTVGASAILHGEGPPHHEVPTGNPQFYIDVQDYTGNPQYYNLWGWVDGTFRFWGWRNFDKLWKTHFEHDDVETYEEYVWDFVKGNPEEAEAQEIVDVGLTRNLSEQAEAQEMVSVGLIRSPIHTAIVTEDILITLIPFTTSLLNGAEINSFALGE